MSWSRRYKFRLYLRNSTWILPVLSIGAALLTAALLHRIEISLGLRMEMGPDTARTVMGAIVGSMFTLVVVASSAVLVAVQMASSQLTPRIISFVYRSKIRKAGLSFFVFTFTFSLAVLVRIEASVPLLMSYLA